MFVDNSGRRSKLLRRIGLLVGVLCVGYAVVLGLAFMGIGTSNPSSLLPFGSGQGQGGPGAQNGNGPGTQPQGGIGDSVRPSGSPPALPSGVPTPAASATAD